MIIAPLKVVHRWCLPDDIQLAIIYAFRIDKGRRKEIGEGIEVGTCLIKQIFRVSLTASVHVLSAPTSSMSCKTKLFYTKDQLSNLIKCD